MYDSPLAQHLQHLLSGGDTEPAAQDDDSIVGADGVTRDRAVDPMQGMGHDNHLMGNTFDPILAQLVAMTGAVPPRGYNGRYW